MTDSRPDVPEDVVVLPAELRRPRPTAIPELAALLRELLGHWGFERRATDAIAIDGALTAPGIDRLAVTASRITLPSFDERPPAALPEAELEEIAGRLEEFHLVGDDLRWEGARFSITARLRGLGFDWLMLGEQLVGLRFPEAGTESASGSLRLEAELTSAVEAIRRAIDRQVQPHGARVRKLRVKAGQLDDRTFRVELDAAARWKLLPVSGRLALTATLDEELVLRFTDVRATSRNPLCAVALAIGRRHLDEAFAEPVALREEFGPELTDLTVRLQPHLFIEASFADLR